MENKILFSILHTSARPEHWRKIYDAWLSAAVMAGNVEYVLVSDPRWGFARPYDVALSASMRPLDQSLMNSGRMCYVDGVNIAAAASTGRVLIVIADDQFPCEEWDAKLLDFILQHDFIEDAHAGKTGGGDGPFLPYNRELVASGYQFGEFVIRATTNTPQERERNITVMPIVSRARYARLGYLLWPEYESMYADNDLSEHAQQDGCLIEAPDLVFPHRHALWDDSVKWDEAYEQQNRQPAYDYGKLVLDKRRADRYGMVSANPDTKKALVACFPGEEFQWTWVVHLVSLLAEMSQRFRLIPPIFSATSSAYVTRNLMAQQVMRLEVKPDYVLWIDDDNLVTAQHLAWLTEDLDANPDLDMVAGWCYIDLPGCQMAPEERKVSCGVFNELGLGVSITVGELAAKQERWGEHLKPIDWTGFPVVLMRRSLLEALGDMPFTAILNEQWTFKMSGEDFAFCWRAKNGGHTIAVDSRVRVPHLKYRPDEPGDLVAVAVEEPKPPEPEPQPEPAPAPQPERETVSV